MQPAEKKGPVLEEEEPCAAWSGSRVTAAAAWRASPERPAAGGRPGLIRRAVAGAGVAARVRAATSSRIDFGAAERVDISCRTKARKMKIPPAHQLVLVRRSPACREPSTAGDDEAPPKLAARPPPLPDCSRTAAARIRASRIRENEEDVYMATDHWVWKNEVSLEE